MDEVLHANIFFVIASVGVVLFTLLVCIFLLYVIRIARAISRIVDRIEAGSETIAEDITAVREALHPRLLMKLVAGIFGLTRRKSRRKDDDEMEGWDE